MRGCSWNMARQSLRLWGCVVNRILATSDVQAARERQALATDWLEQLGDDEMAFRARDILQAFLKDIPHDVKLLATTPLGSDCVYPMVDPFMPVLFCGVLTAVLAVFTASFAGPLAVLVIVPLLALEWRLVRSACRRVITYLEAVEPEIA